MSIWLGLRQLMRGKMASIHWPHTALNELHACAGRQLCHCSMTMCTACSADGSHSGFLLSPQACVSLHIAALSLALLFAEVVLAKNSSTLQTTFNGARTETEMVLFSCCQKLMDSLSMTPNQVPYPTCSLFTGPSKHEKPIC